MPGTFFGMNIARSGMLTYNTLLNTTGHNIANVRTEGYSKQIVNQEATVPIKVGTSYGMIGSGVDAISIDNQRDIYYDEKYRLSNTEYGKYETASTFLNDIQALLWANTLETSGITNTMDQFLKSMSGWTTSSEKPTTRTEVVGYADQLMYEINELADKFKDIQKSLNGQIADTVDQINAYAQEIASLTQQINTLEIYGSKACDLRDQRAHILDQLSELVDVDVNEVLPKEGEGVQQYIVSVDNAVLVDTYDVNLLRYEARESYNSLDDIDGLYDLRWSTKQDFGIHSTILGGKLQALFELRDGNNGEILTGKVASVAKGDTEVRVTDINELGSTLFKLQIPEQNGVLTIDHAEYEYEYFDCTVGNDGKYTYVFHLKDSIGMAMQNVDARVSEAVDFRGIPYYQSQLNEFVRTFAYYFNEQHMQGYDIYDNAGTQMFVCRDKVDDTEYNFSSDTERNLDPTKEWLYGSSSRGFSFTTNPKATSGVSSDLGNLITQKNTDAGRTEYRIATYYKMTASTVSVDSKIAKNGNLLAASDTAGRGVANGFNLEKLSALRSNKTMFQEGEPANFLKTLTTTVGVDRGKSVNSSQNAENIRNSVDSRRMSKSGVDEDEEGQNLIICQNLLNYQYKVLSVMDEVLDKLINGTAV